MIRRGTPPLWLFFSVVVIMSVASIASWPSVGNAQAVHIPDKHRSLTGMLPSCNRQQIIQFLLKPGVLEIWNTGSASVRKNTVFDPLHYAATRTDRKPLFIGADLDPTSLHIGQDQQTGDYFIDFRMSKAAILKSSRLATFIIDKYITITTNKMVVSSVILGYQFSGEGHFQMSRQGLAALHITCVKIV